MFGKAPNSWLLGSAAVEVPLQEPLLAKRGADSIRRQLVFPAHLAMPSAGGYDND